MLFDTLRVRIETDFSVSRLVRNFIFADLLLIGGWGFVGPIFPIFITEQVRGASLISVGATVALYWFVKSLAQLPIADYLDRTEGERDDFFVLLTGLLLAGFSAMSFILVDELWKLYVVQFLHALSMGMVVPAWSAIFSRHLDKNKYAITWSLDSTAIGISAGIGGFFGGVMAAQFGFSSVFLIAGICSFVAAIVIFFVPDLIFPVPKREEATIKDHSAGGPL